MKQQIMDKNEYIKWIQSQDWYQTIELKNGIVTKGKFPTNLRLKHFSDIPFKGKRVLDVGCNSGQYCLVAKAMGAKEVIGVDIDEKRLEQARTLALNEGLEIEYLNKTIFEISDLGVFDIVLCVAVLTEVQDFFGAVESLKRVIGGYAFIELALAKPLLYVSKSKLWLKGNSKIPRGKSLTEVRQTKRGTWVINPSLELLSAVFGEGYTVSYRGAGLRYDIIEVFKRPEKSASKPENKVNPQDE